MTKSNKFGAFGGVFTPSILTILGVIMYMRLPMIIGEAGLWATLGIIVVAHIISITTGLSVSSIATDKKVKAGGTYYIISRSLGLPIGGTLGLALFVGLSFSVSLYLIGFAESFLGFWGFPVNIQNIRIAGSIILLTVTIITFISTSLAIKAQYLIMTAIFLSLLSIFFGSHEYAPAEPHFFSSGSTISLMVLFGIFFPAVTGFEAGVSMSGDLKDPKKSIPMGTIAAIAVGLVVYVFLIFFFSYTVDGAVLANDPNVLLNISLVPELVVAGIWGATLSSALGSILAAPRILQATAIDKITPKFFARGTKSANEPRNAILVTFLIAQAGILIGDLEVIARIVSIFFITTYGFLNISAAFEASTSADFRPSFRIPVWVSLIGAAACILVMIQLDFLALVGATIILGLLFLFLKRRQLSLEGGDAWSSVWASLVKTGIQRLNKSQVQARNWRPNIIMFSGGESDRPHLVTLGNSLTGNLGMVTGFDLEVIKDHKLLKKHRRKTRIVDHKEIIFYEHLCQDVYSGMDEIVRVYGFTGVEPNTVFMGWAKKEERKEQFEHLIRIFEKNNISSIFLNHDSKRGFGDCKTIDFWWEGDDRNLAFAINIIRHLTSSPDWKDAKVRILIVINHKAFIEKAYLTLHDIVKRYRINLEVKVINNSVDAYPWGDIVKRESADTDLTITGLPSKIQGQFEQIYTHTNMLKQNLGTLLHIKASTLFEEYNLGIDASQKESQSVFDSLVVLPDLVLSKYPVINNDILKIDQNGQLELEAFYSKTFIPCYTESHNFFNELRALVDNMGDNLNKVLKYSDSHRRSRMIVKTKNDFYYHAKQVLEKLLNEKLLIQQHALEEGISWYLDRLDKDMDKFPHRLKVNYEREDFRITKADHPGMRWYKTRKQILHFFSRKTIAINVRYKVLADFYLRTTRHFFLHEILDKFYAELEDVFSKLRPLFIACEEQLDVFEKKILEKTFSRELIEEFVEEMMARITGIESEITELEDLNRNRLFVEYRKNLQLMIRDLERIDVNKVISKTKKGKRLDKSNLEEINAFPELWHNDSLNYFNKIYLDVLLQSYKNRIKDKLHELENEFYREIEAGLLKRITSIRERLNAIDGDFSGVQDLKLSIASAEEYFHFISEFESITAEFRQLENKLPENLTLSESSPVEGKSGGSGKPEEIIVPLQKITGYIVETQFVAFVNDELGRTMESLKSSIYKLKDYLSLARFNFENIHAEAEDQLDLINQIREETTAKLVKEEALISELKKKVMPSIHKKLDETFDNLSSYKISESLEEYSRFRIDDQGRIVKSKFNLSYRYLNGLIRRKSARLLYSKSEGILLAKNLIAFQEQTSKNEKILDLIDKVTPRPETIKNLPHHYMSLFSGRSSIVDDFWIPRKEEEAQFEKAIRRFRAGVRGAIMLLGERNSGKTALCRYVTRIHFKEDKLHIIFPLQAGSVNRDDFLVQLQKTTRLSGGINEIFDTLPYGSVIVINDLEMWWERSEQGFDFLEMLLELMGRFDYKCLFVINMNPFAYELINGVLKMENHFISIINCRPFTSEELKEMIMRRHRSSGMKFSIRKREEGQISEIALAKLFNRYFDLSDGNPGSVLYQWLSNIEKVSFGNIRIKPPRALDLQPIEELDDDVLIVLVQLTLRKRMKYGDLERILGIEPQVAKEMVNSLSRMGILEERFDKVLLINPYIEPFVRKVLKRRGLV